jgi:excisionase family DNA binding protein
VTGEGKVLLASEAAAILRVPEARVYELVRQGRLPAVHIGRLVRIPEDALRKWIAEGGVTVQGNARNRRGQP